MDTTHTTLSNEQRLEVAHASLIEAVAKVATSEDWQNLLRISGSFHRYSPNNQLFLAAQGADGLVASFNTWKQIPAVDGRPCQIRKGEKALRVYAPIRTVHREVDEDTGDEIIDSIAVRFKLVPVFHQGQLVAPPDLPAQPKLLIGDDPPDYVWHAIADQIAAAGFALKRGPLDGPDGPKGITNFIERTVTVRDDLAPAQALKTQIHELGHVMMHYATITEPGMARDRMEVEAESVAYVVCDILGVDAGSYSIPYVANWAGADVERVRSTAQKVLTTARQIVARLETDLGVDLTPDPFAEIAKPALQPTVEPPRELVAAGSTDQIIFDHLARGPLDWQRLAASIPALETRRSRISGNDPGAQAIVLAEAGASPEANVAVLRTHGLGDDTIVALLTVYVPDSLRQKSTLYTRDEALQALDSPTPVKPLVDQLVVDLLISAGQHPQGARHLARTSAQPASVVSLMEERLRRDSIGHSHATSRHNRGLALIDDWTSSEPRGINPEGVAPTPTVMAVWQPDPPGPPAA